MIVWTTNKIVGWRLDRLQKRFPVGRKRLEPLGILVFSIIMVISFAQILQESVEKLMPLEGEAEALGNAAIAALVATVVVKGTLRPSLSLSLLTYKLHKRKPPSPKRNPSKRLTRLLLHHYRHHLVRLFPNQNHPSPSPCQRLQNRRQLQHPLPPLSPHRLLRRHLVARSRRRRHSIHLHHFRLGFDVF